MPIFFVCVFQLFVFGVSSSCTIITVWIFFTLFSHFNVGCAPETMPNPVVANAGFIVVGHGLT